MGSILYSYYKYIDTEAEEIVLYELDLEYYCLRSILVTASLSINTNLNIEQAHFFLPEVSFSDVLDEIIPIEKDEFLNFWNQSISKYLSDWNELKNKFKIGQSIETEIVCFYPQEVIVQYGERFYVLASYKDCESCLGSKNMYPQQKIRLCVESFDHENLWINFSIAPPSALT